MSHVAPWVDTSGRGVRGPVYNTVDNANWHRTCAYTPYTYTVAHAPSRADFTRDFTSADTPAAPRAPERGRAKRERPRPGADSLRPSGIYMVRGRKEREPVLRLLARGRGRRVLAQVGGEGVGELVDVVARRPRAAGQDSSEKRVGRGPREPWVARGRRPRHRRDHARERALWGRHGAPRRHVGMGRR